MNIIKKNPIFSYFFSVFFITWGSVIYIALPKLRSSTVLEFEDVGMMFLCMIFAPSCIGILFSGLAYGKEGLSDLFSRMRKCNVHFKWYFIAVFTTPILLIITLLILSVVGSTDFLPGFQVIGIILGMTAGIFEEIGWTGFALPALMKKFNPIKSGIILGVLWGLWHFMADYLGASEVLGSAWFPTFFFRYIMALTAYRLLMVWVYNNTKSVFVAQIMHGCFSATLYLLGPVTSNENGVIWNGIFAVVLWLFVSVILFKTDKHSMNYHEEKILRSEP